MNAPRTPDPRLPPMTTDQFLLWAEEQPSGRYELVNGEVFAMAPERVEHVETKFEAATALRQAVKARGLDCQVLIDGMAVRIDERTAYEPDALLRCGPRLPRGTLEASDPLVVIEVASPSARHMDVGVKLEGYLSLPSVRHYLILNPERRWVVHHRRADVDRIETRILHARPSGDGPPHELVLDPPGLAVPVAHLFEAP